MDNRRRLPLFQSSRGDRRVSAPEPEARARREGADVEVAARSSVLQRAQHRLRRAAMDAQVVAGMYSKRFAPVGPRILQFAVPAPCDHNCSFCITPYDLPDGRNATNKRFDYPSAVKMIDDAVELGTLRFNISSWGETLLFPRIKELISHIQTRSRGAAIIKIVTHGALIEKVGLDFFIDHGVNFWVSLHGGDFETWEKIHQPGGKDARRRFASLQRSLRTLVRSGRNEVTLHNVICNQNHDRIEGIIDFARNVGVPNLNFHIVRSEEDRLLSVEQRAGLRDRIPALARYAEGLSHNLDGFAMELGEEEEQPRHWNADGTGYYNHHRCYIGWLMTFVNLEGDVMPCCRGAPVGNVQDERLSEVWREGYDDFRQWSVNIATQGPRPGYDCESCSHLTLNDRANRLVKL